MYVCIYMMLQGLCACTSHPIHVYSIQVSYVNALSDIQEAYTSVKRGLCQCQERPILVSKEAYKLEALFDVKEATATTYNNMRMHHTHAIRIYVYTPLRLREKTAPTYMCALHTHFLCICIRIYPYLFRHEGGNGTTPV